LNKNLLFIPGLLCNDDLWQGQTEALGQDYNLMTGDHRSHDNLPEMVKALLEKAPETFTLAGLSMGGYIAFEVMRQAPQRVEKLILLDTNARADNSEQKRQRQQMMAADMEHEIAELIEERLSFLIRATCLSDQNLCRRIIHMAEDTGMQAYLRQQNAMLNRPDSRPGLKDISCPTLIICGEADMLTPPKVHHEMADLIAGSELHILKDCGHLSTMEKPAEVNRLMKDFLEK